MLSANVALVQLRDTCVKKVKKSGPNQGRDFFCCGKRYGGRCDFFEFKDNYASESAVGSPNKKARYT